MTIMYHRTETSVHSFGIKTKWKTEFITISRQSQIIIIGLSGKFVPILKENLNAENLNFSIHLLNYISRHELSGQPNMFVSCKILRLYTRI